MTARRNLRTSAFCSRSTTSASSSTSIVPSLLKASTSNWTWDGKLYHVPHCWGTEAISWRNDLTKIAPDDLSFGTLWNDEYKGKVQGRPHSLLLGIGLWMDGTGKLPTNRMLDAFKRRRRDEENLRRAAERGDRPQGLDQAISGIRPTTPNRA